MVTSVTSVRSREIASWCRPSWVFTELASLRSSTSRAVWGSSQQSHTYTHANPRWYNVKNQRRNKWAPCTRTLKGCNGVCILRAGRRSSVLLCSELGLQRRYFLCVALINKSHLLPKATLS